MNNLSQANLDAIAEWTIILVDDEPDSLHLLADMLSLHGAEVYSASNGTSCLDLLKAIIPSAIVVDLNMPSPDGWDLLDAIRAQPRLAQVPVIAVTAYYSEKVEDEARRAGFDAFVRKPVKSGSLLALLHDLIA